MTPSKALSSRQLSPVVSLSLKVVGIIIVVAALIDLLILPYPFQVLEREWQISFVTQIVDRGIVPLVGLALMLVGFWIDSVAGGGDRKPSQDYLKLGALIFSSVLGLFFLLIIPVHLNNVRVSGDAAVKRINEQAQQAESQVGTQLQTTLGQERQQLEQLLANPDQLNQVLESGQVPQEQATLLKQFQSDPQAFDQFISKRTDELKQRFQTEIGTRREDALKKAETESLKSGVRISISSLLLAIGYIFIGWMGLRNW